MSDHIFVYGTLLPELVPPTLTRLAAQLRPVAPARVRGRLYDLTFYPGAVVDAAADSYITGYVYALPEDPELLSFIDRYESFDPADPQYSLYLRQRHPALLSDGSEIECWIYVYNLATEGVPLIEGGDYAKFKSEANVSAETTLDLQNPD
ncbi:MAG TPA: gamma-glutamylcyclotransferase family protein [Abditibacteriaceae bacterium]|nr:gamma-glutamylcyclotransferase family protein [Abditibacteriaceae bacterium]